MVSERGEIEHDDASATQFDDAVAGQFLKRAIDPLPRRQQAIGKFGLGQPDCCFSAAGFNCEIEYRPGDALVQAVHDIAGQQLIGAPNIPGKIADDRFRKRRRRSRKRQENVNRYAKDARRRQRPGGGASVAPVQCGDLSKYVAGSFGRYTDRAAILSEDFDGDFPFQNDVDALRRIAGGEKDPIAFNRMNPRHTHHNFALPVIESGKKPRVLEDACLNSG